ncbi:hypothetical protein SNOG_06532 [Parastagonospora nodorum SN15]|uniref:Uncharacterized protein n=1 Tax=Phaeosphaeria nodorum (strain SN15 / ATCC MYA-4574 / FGSC 10173) TaxID=321614 RepID=Q0UNY2_PHANO|nr:hypothetical protein SNOG_06532 [Parastagonospora nodorum SN15]EAT86363.1 hypothetical protein SNOG_06532 [Parastagonospora nodorum SN15]
MTSRPPVRLVTTAACSSEWPHQPLYFTPSLPSRSCTVALLHGVIPAYANLISPPPDQRLSHRTNLPPRTNFANPVILLSQGKKHKTITRHSPPVQQALQETAPPNRPPTPPTLNPPPTPSKLYDTNPCNPMPITIGTRDTSDLKQKVRHQSSQFRAHAPSFPSEP